MYDITMAIKEDMLLYKGRKHLKPEIKTISDFDNSSAHETELRMNLHTGTHLDAPLHMIPEGADSNQLLENDLFYRAKVVPIVEQEKKITLRQLQQLEIEAGDFIIFKTKNSQPNYLKNHPKEFIYLAKDAAKYLSNKAIQGVGIDSIGIERNQSGHPTHKSILGKEIMILEGLRLKDVPAGKYVLMLAPLKIKTSDALPLRAVLYEKQELIDKLDFLL